jgi:transposase
MKASCSKCGKDFSSRKKAVEHATTCQVGWNPTIQDLLSKRSSKGAT